VDEGALSKSILQAAGNSIQQECKDSGQWHIHRHTRII